MVNWTMVNQTGIDMAELFAVLYEDNHLLVVDKPAGLLVQGDRSGDETLLDRARSYLKQKYNKPGKVYIGLVHRLDRNVSGVVVLARTSKAAGRLSEQFRAGSPAKIYLAVVEGRLPEPEATLTAWLAPDGDARGVTCARFEPFEGARESRLGYETLEQRRVAGRDCTLVRIRLITGRRHQIRAQLALVGCPLLGDRKYGAGQALPDHRIALHAARLELTHPVGARPLAWEAPLPADWPWPGHQEDS